MITMLIVSFHSHALKWDNMEVSCSLGSYKEIKWKKQDNTIFTSRTRDLGGTTILCGHPSHVKVYRSVCRAKEAPSFLSYAKTLSIDSAQGMEPTTSCSAVKRFTKWANPAMVKTQLKTKVLLGCFEIHVIVIYIRNNSLLIKDTISSF